MSGDITRFSLYPPLTCFNTNTLTCTRTLIFFCLTVFFLCVFFRVLLFHIFFPICFFLVKFYVFLVFCALLYIYFLLLQSFFFGFVVNLVKSLHFSIYLFAKSICTYNVRLPFVYLFNWIFLLVVWKLFGINSVFLFCIEQIPFVIQLNKVLPVMKRECVMELSYCIQIFNVLIGAHSAKLEAHKNKQQILSAYCMIV